MVHNFVVFKIIYIQGRNSFRGSVLGSVSSSRSCVCEELDEKPDYLQARVRLVVARWRKSHTHTFTHRTVTKGKRRGAYDPALDYRLENRIQQRLGSAQRARDRILEKGQR